VPVFVLVLVLCPFAVPLALVLVPLVLALAQAAESIGSSGNWYRQRLGWRASDSQCMCVSCHLRRSQGAWADLAISMDDGFDGERILCNCIVPPFHHHSLVKMAASLLVGCRCPPILIRFMSLYLLVPSTSAMMHARVSIDCALQPILVSRSCSCVLLVMLASKCFRGHMT